MSHTLFCSNFCKVVIPMPTRYQTEIHEKLVGKTEITVSNATPVYHREQKAAVRAKIERRLYEIFIKYVSVRS